MARRGRLLVVVGAALATTLTLAACGSGDSGGGKSDSPLIVGMVAPQSGVYAAIGTDMQNGFQTYLNTHDNKIGGRSVEVKIADAGSSPNEAIPAVQRVLSREHADVLTGIVSSATAIALEDTINRAKKLTLIANAGADALTCAKKSEYVWRTSFANSSDGAALAKYMAETLDPPTAYVIAPDYAAGQEKAAGFEAAFKAAGGTIVGQAFPPFGTTRDYQPYLSKIKAAQPSAVWAFFAGAEAVQFVKQYGQMGLKATIPLFGNNSLLESQVLKAVGDAALGDSMASYYSPDLDNAENKKFASTYEKKYKEEPSVYAVGAYDAAAVLDKAMAKTDGSADGGKLAEAMGQLGTISSPRGDWHFDDNHNPVETYYLYQVKKTDDGISAVEVKSLGPVAQQCS